MLPLPREILGWSGRVQETRYLTPYPLFWMKELARYEEENMEDETQDP